MQYEVLKPFSSEAGAHRPGERVDADQFHNTAALIEQRYIRPIGDGEKIARLQAQVDQLRDRVNAMESRGKGGGK